jgi:hypothetical protein
MKPHFRLRVRKDKLGFTWFVVKYRSRGAILPLTTTPPYYNARPAIAAAANI